MNRFPEIRFLKFMFSWLGPWVLLISVGYAVIMAAVFLVQRIPAIHAALWPGWGFGLVAAYVGTVIVRALR